LPISGRKSSEFHSFIEDRDGNIIIIHGKNFRNITERTVKKLQISFLKMLINDNYFKRYCA
jgi:hypothetical protein